MGKCAANCCSSDDRMERKAMNAYTNSDINPVDTTSTASSQNTTEQMSTPDITPNNWGMDAKTIQLLSNLDGLGITLTPDGDEKDANNEALAVNASPSLDELERNVNSYRVKAFKEIMDPDELKSALTQQYGSEEDEEDESSYSDREKEEIERRKSQKEMSKSKSQSTSKLYRDNTVSPWTETEIVDLEKDMNKQLLSLQQEALQEKASQPTLLDLKTDDSRVFRAKSAETWADEEMLQTKDEMQKEMIHLLMDNTQENDVSRPKSSNE